MKKSLKKDRWNPLDLGAHANYSAEKVAQRWETNRRDWVDVSKFGALTLQNESYPKKTKSGENDVRGAEKTSTIPQDPDNTERR